MEHDVAGITATICTTLEHFGNVSNRAQARSALCRWAHSKCSSGGAIPMSAAFEFARYHLQGVKGFAVAFA